MKEYRQSITRSVDVNILHSNRYPFRCLDLVIVVAFSYQILLIMFSELLMHGIVYVCVIMPSNHFLVVILTRTGILLVRCLVFSLKWFGVAPCEMNPSHVQSA